MHAPKEIFQKISKFRKIRFPDQLRFVILFILSDV